MLAPPSASSPVSPGLSPTQTLADSRVPQKYSSARRYVLLVVFCLAQFLDAYNAAALFSAIPAIVTSLKMTEAESTWIISAFQLTFASFLLIVSFSIPPSCRYLLTRLPVVDNSVLQSGRISDVYNPSEFQRHLT